MKLKNGGKGEVNITDIDNWVKKALDAMPEGFPIVTRIMKGLGTPKYKTIQAPSKFDRWAEVIREKNHFTKKEFKTISDVYRAALYIGFRLLHERFKDLFPSDHEVHSINEIYKAMEGPYVAHQVIHWHTHAIKKLIPCRNSGVMSRKEYDDAVLEIINCVPERFRKFVAENAKKLEAGEKVIDLYDTEYYQWGGKRDGSGR